MNCVGDVVVCAFVGGDARGAVGDGYRWKVKGEWCNVGEVECDGEGEADVCFFFCFSSVCLFFFGFCSLCRGGECGACACHGYIFFPFVSIFPFFLCS